MNGQIIKKHNEFTMLMFHAQGGLCFCCDHPMALLVEPKRPKAKGCTREHIFPKAKVGGKHKNIVLSHPPCNAVKADRWPTAFEIEKAKLIYHYYQLLLDAVHDELTRQVYDTPTIARIKREPKRKKTTARRREQRKRAKLRKAA